ncbi:MAG: hypothetical protein H7222_14130 [Methylotenera sp.]|nr:hypothetical protein [Oligoflexia bacterium]
MRYTDSQLPSLLHQLGHSVRRIEELSNALASEPVSTATVVREALLFNLEAAAWACLELGKFWVYEERIGIPKKETEVFDLLVGQKLLEIDRARRLRYIGEWRNVSSRDPIRIDWDYVQGDLSIDVLIMKAWGETLRERFDAQAKAT